MLSLIVSSYQQHYFEQFSENVKATIGKNFDYEIIQIWNPGLMGICEAYNKGAEKAQYENLLFVHEDVLFETKDWGRILIDYLSDNQIGCVGLAGSSVKTKFPIAWWDIRDKAFLNLNQYTKVRGVESYTFENDQEVKILDGVFIAVKKIIWQNNKFNINNNSFHGYDVEFSLKISENYKNIVLNKILISHFSEGKLSKEWFIEICRIYMDNNKFNIKTSVDEVKFFFNYLKMFDFKRNEKICIFLKFYNPLNFSIMNNLRILKRLYLIY